MKANFKQIVNSEKPVLVDFHAEWCGPCKAQGPILKEVAGALGDRARIIKIDVDKNQEIANRYRVKGVPTLMLFKNGSVQWKTSGVVDKQQLLQTIRKVL